MSDLKSASPKTNDKLPSLEAAKADRPQPDENPHRQRRHRLSRQGTLTFEECEIVASGGKLYSFDASSNSLNIPPRSVKRESPNHARRTTTTGPGSSDIYGASDHVRMPIETPKPERDTPLKQPISNYQIKAIRRGVPDIPTHNRRSGVKMATRELEVSKFCVCKRGDKENRSATAWTFSIFVAAICVLSPLLSFASDVAFFVMCSDHYNDTESLLLNIRSRHFPSAFVTQHDFATIQDSDVMVAQFRGYPPPPLLSANSKVNDKAHQQTHVLRHVRNKRPFGLKTPCTKSANETALENDSKICRNVSEILAFMRTDEALRRLEAHRRVTVEVFEPVFIIGSFPSLLFSIFTRLVVMLTWHDHFISAYVINIAVMPLQLVTGALGVHTASYHMGDLGFACWECAAHKGDCSDLGYDHWIDDDVNKTLVVALILKIVDGGAGGVVIFVVLLRILWKDHGHVTCWWYGIRGLICLVSFLLCIGASSLLVITPALGVIRLQVMPKMPDFAAKSHAEFVTTVLLAMGFTVWSVSLSTLLIYLVYRCYVYCRLREHMDGMHEIDF